MVVDSPHKLDSFKETVDTKIMLEAVVKDSSIKSSLSHQPNKLLASEGINFP